MARLSSRRSTGEIGDGSLHGARVPYALSVRLVYPPDMMRPGCLQSAVADINRPLPCSDVGVSARSGAARMRSPNERRRPARQRAAIASFRQR